jgi:hypothetical protein
MLRAPSLSDSKNEPWRAGDAVKLPLVKLENYDLKHYLIKAKVIVANPSGRAASASYPARRRFALI